MKAAVWYGSKDLRIEDIATPEPGPGQVLIQVARNGLCGSDLHTYVGSDTGGAAMHVPGVVLGHEFSGIVREVGDGVTDLPTGTAVAVAPTEWCGTCWSCKHSWPQMCRKLALYGGYREPLHGGLAPFVAVSRRSCYVVPSGLGVVEAALTEPMAVAVHAVRRGPSTLGAAVLVLGAGPIGLGVLQSVQAGGARATIITDLSPARRAAAKVLGATAVIDPANEDLRAAVRDISRQGVDIVFDTTASSVAFNQGIALVRPRGTIVSVAGWQEFAKVDMGRAMVNEIDIRYSMTYEPETDFPATLAMLAGGSFDCATMISDHIPLERVVDDGLEELLHHPEHHIKILVDPS